MSIGLFCIFAEMLVLRCAYISLVEGGFATPSLLFLKN